MIKIGIIGDYDSQISSHPATDAAIEHAAKHLDIKIDFDWIPTLSLMNKAKVGQLELFDGVWISSGSPYRSIDGALNGIKLVRERNRPLFAT